MVEPSRWAELIARDPEHSLRYVERFRRLAAEGQDLDGEARLVDAMVGRGSRILDAGCGPGRVGGALHRAGHDVVGVDADPVLVEAAQVDHPGPRWIVADLAQLDLPAAGVEADFDAIVAAGNVMAFLAPSTRRVVLGRLRSHLAPAGRIVVGFGRDRDYEVDEFRSDVAASGLTVDLELATWDLRPHRPDADFLVAVLSDPGSAA